MFVGEKGTLDGLSEDFLNDELVLYSFLFSFEDDLITGLRFSFCFLSLDLDLVIGYFFDLAST
jgi:hypothetical protein